MFTDETDNKATLSIDDTQPALYLEIMAGEGNQTAYIVFTGSDDIWMLIESLQTIHDEMVELEKKHDE